MSSAPGEGFGQGDSVPAGEYFGAGSECGRHFAGLPGEDVAGVAGFEFPLGQDGLCEGGAQDLDDDGTGALVGAYPVFGADAEFGQASDGDLVEKVGVVLAGVVGAGTGLGPAGGAVNRACAQQVDGAAVIVLSPGSV